MDSVLCPMLRWRVFDRLVKNGLEGNERGAEGFRDAFGCSTITIKLRKPFVIDCATAQDKRLANDQLNLRQGLARAFQQLPVIVLIGFECPLVFAVERMPE